MINIVDLQDVLENCLLQIVCGYVFIIIFNAVCLKKNQKDIKNLLLSAFSVGFLLVKIYEIIPININKTVDTIGMCLTSIVIAYLLGRFFIGEKFDKMLETLKICQSKNVNIWANLNDFDCSFKIKIVMNDDTIYKGYVYEIGDETPVMIAIVAYEIKKGNNTIVNGVTNENNKIMIVNTNDMKYAEIGYSVNSKKIKRIKSFNDIVRKNNQTP